MRKFLSGLVVAAFVTFSASSALAVSALWQIDPAGTDGTIVGNEIRDIAIGDQVTLFITVDNASGDAIQSLFTSFQFDTNVLEFAGGGSLGTVLIEPGFGGPSLGVVAQPQPVFGGAPGEYIALAYASTGDPTTATGPEITTQLVFNVIGTGTSAVTQFTGPGDESIINGVVGVIDFGSEVLVVVPEPGTALLMGLGLFGLASAGRRNA